MAVRNAARLYEPARRLPQMARTLIPFVSLIRSLPGWPATPYRTTAVRARQSRAKTRDQARGVVALDRSESLGRKAVLLQCVGLQRGRHIGEIGAEDDLRWRDHL